MIYFKRQNIEIESQLALIIFFQLKDPQVKISLRNYKFRKKKIYNTTIKYDRVIRKLSRNLSEIISNHSIVEKYKQIVMLYKMNHLN